MIEININLVFTIINLIVLYLLMKKFLFGPILNVMEQRKNMIDQQFASAKDTEEQAYELKGKYEDALKSAKDESMRIVNQAKDEAKVQAERIVKDANTQAGAMLDKAKADIRTEQENAMKAMESRVAEIALDAASKIMGEKNSRRETCFFLISIHEFIPRNPSTHISFTPFISIYISPEKFIHTCYMLPFPKQRKLLPVLPNVSAHCRTPDYGICFPVP